MEGNGTVKFVVGAIIAVSALATEFYVGYSAAPEWDVKPLVTDYSKPYITNLEPLEVKMGSKTTSIDIMKVGRPSSDQIAKGKQLFENTCTACHGIGGKGDGVAAVALNPKPRNFHLPDNWKNGRRINDMFKTLAEGIPGGAMAAFDYLPVKDRLAILHYVRSLADHFPAVQDSELKQISDDYNLAGGSSKEVLVQIPIDTAIEKLTEEGQSIISDIDKKLAFVNQHASTDGAKIFNTYSSNRKEALKSLSSTTIWKNNVDEFAKIITSSNNGGFKQSVGSLDKEELKKMQSFLANL